MEVVVRKSTASACRETLVELSLVLRGEYHINYVESEYDTYSTPQWCLFRTVPKNVRIWRFTWSKTVREPVVSIEEYGSSGEEARVYLFDHSILGEVKEVFDGSAHWKYAKIILA